MQIAGLNIGIVADDMTGASDTALQFFLVGSESHIILDIDAPEETLETIVTQAQQAQNKKKSKNEDSKTTLQTTWSLNTQSRHQDPKVAEAQVRKAVRLLKEKLGAENYYKKIDSTLRGHIAHECLGFLDELNGDCALIAPAFPQQGRLTVGGYQLVNGLPIERTSVARDPLFPVRTSHIPTLLEENSKPEIVGHIDLSTVLHGAGPILVKLNELIAEGKRLVVADATSQEDLEQIALALNKVQKTYKVLPCGSAGLASALTKTWCNDKPTATQPVDIPVVKPEKLNLPNLPVLIVSGSNTSTTRQQILKLIDQYSYYSESGRLEIFNLSASQILGETPIEDDLKNICNALEQGHTVVLSTSLKETNYADTITLGKELDMEDDVVARKAQDLLSSMTQHILEKQPAILVLTGGETAASIAETLDTDCLTIKAETEPAIPLMQDDQNRWVITKSGSFGSPLVFAKLIQFLNKHSNVEKTVEAS